MTWSELLDHMITVEGECMEENYGKGRALNDADEECNAGIRRAYASLLKVKPALMAAPEMLAACRQAMSAITYLLSNDDDDPGYADTLNTLAAAIARAEGRGE